MKRELAVAGIALVVSILLSSPTFAQTKNPAPNAAPAPAPIETTTPAHAEELSIDDAIMMASTPEERAAVLRRCSGPPPRIMTPVVAQAPANERAVLAE